MFAQKFQLDGFFVVVVVHSPVTIMVNTFL